MKKIFTLIASLMMVLSMSAATKTIYCKMAHDWWYADGAAVGAHYWTEGGAGTKWPGVRMTPVTGESDLWSIDIDTDKYKQIIFTRVNGSGTIADYGAKTADLTIPTDDKNLYTITSTSPVWGDPGVKGEWSTYTPNAPKTYKDITFTITANAAPQIHYWDGGDKMVGSVWENLPTMTATGNANEYTYTVKDVDEAKGVNYLLKIGNIQTADQHTTENVTADFKDLMPEVYVKGVTGWDGDGHKMTIADDCASASVTITLAANLTADLKLIIGGAWMGDTKNAITKDNNSSVFDTNGQNGSIKTDIAGDYIFTYTYADKTLTVTYPTEEIEVAVDCYVTGNTALTGEDWVLNSENLKMTKVEGTEKYTYTFTALPANTAFELKVVYANSQKGFSSLSEAIDGVTANGDNICFTLEETGDVTVTYDAETEKIALTGNFAIPVTYDYYIAGTLAGGWSATQQGMEKEGDVYKHTFSELNAGTYEFKITDGQFNSADDNTHEHTTLGAAYVEVSYNEGNIKIDTDQAINLTVIFDATEDKITFEGLTETTPAKCYLMGIGGDWITGIEMEEDGEQFKLLCQPIAEDDQFKFKHGDIWSDGVENYDFPGINWVDDDNDGDYHITLPAGNYNFYYKKNDNKVWIEAATDCEPTPDYTRTVGNNQFGTICLPFGGTITGAVLYECVGSETGKVYLGSVNTLTAGVPYIFQATATELAVYSDGTTAANPGNSNGLHGTFTNDTEVAVGNYILKGNALCQAATTCYVNANRAYLVMSEVPTGAPQQMPGRRYIGMSVQGENEATGVEDIFSTDAPVKVIENGQLIIIRDGVKYNVQGQVIK